MKQNYIYSIALVLLMLISTNTYAKSWRINSNASAGAKFADINTAMNSEDVHNDDTLYLDPGTNISSQQTVSKRVTIIGTGYYHHLSQPYGVANFSGGIVMKAANSKIMGVSIQSGCVISANNVTIERCLLNGIGISSNGSNCKKAIIRNCYIYTSTTSIYGQGSTSTNTEQWTIENNFIFNVYSRSDHTITGLYSANLINNYICRSCNTIGYTSYCISNMNNCTILNNIMINYYGYKNSMFNDCTNCIVHNNVLSCVEGQHPNNKCLDSTDEAFIFRMTGNDDLKYRLCEESPAIGYATDGGDCGPYGSGYTYVPGGLPYGIPYYTESNIATMDQNGKLKVSLKIAVNNE